MVFSKGNNYGIDIIYRLTLVLILHLDDMFGKSAC